MKVCPVPTGVFPCVQTDRGQGRQKVMTKLIAAFHNFVNAPKILQSRNKRANILF